MVEAARLIADLSTRATRVAAVPDPRTDRLLVVLTRTEAAALVARLQRCRDAATLNGLAKIRTALEAPPR